VEALVPLNRPLILDSYCACNCECGARWRPVVGKPPSPTHNLGNYHSLLSLSYLHWLHFWSQRNLEISSVWRLIEFRGDAAHSYRLHFFLAEHISLNISFPSWRQVVIKRSGTHQPQRRFGQSVKGWRNLDVSSYWHDMTYWTQYFLVRRGHITDPSRAFIAQYNTWIGDGEICVASFCHQQWDKWVVARQENWLTLWWWLYSLLRKLKKTVRACSHEWIKWDFSRSRVRAGAIKLSRLECLSLADWLWEMLLKKCEMENLKYCENT